jgi:SAM-dependent methyltransferase
LNGQSASVRRYYEANTRWMLAWGSGRGEGVIHRPVWLPGVATRAEAARAVDALILSRLSAWTSAAGSRRGPLRVLDLGCGSGATAVWLARRLAVEITGVTLSPRQVELARRLAQGQGVASRCRFLEGDFLRERFFAESSETEEFPSACPSQPGFDALYAIESFSHGSDTEAFFRQAARRLAPRGLLIVCDDFLAGDVPASGEDRSKAARRRRWLDAFRQGWHLGPLSTEQELLETAGRRGLELEERRDLSPHLRDRSTRARLAYGLLRLLPGNGPWLSSQRGGAALQVCLHEGWVRYLYLVFRRRS